MVKDVAVETGKTGKTEVGYEEKVAEGIKDLAVVAGWGVAHTTTEIALEATKMAGGVAGKAKDVVASAAHKAAEMAEVLVVKARDTAVNAGGSLWIILLGRKQKPRSIEKRNTNYILGYLFR